MRGGFMLIDALVGLALLALLVSALHELRVAQLRSVKRSRARLAATEMAAAAALLGESMRGAMLTREPLPAPPGSPPLVRVVVRAPWSAAGSQGVEEVSVIARAE